MNMSNQKNVTILTLWDWEQIVVNVDIEEFMQCQREDISNWIKELYLSEFKRTVSYADIKWKQGKTRHYYLPQPEQKKLAYTPEQNIEVQKKIDKMMEITYEWRKRNFINNRQVILEKLAKTEKQFEVTTTLDKLEELNLLRQKQILLDIK